MKAKQANFWQQLENQQISKEQIEPFLVNIFGPPINELQTNLLNEILKRITAYYFTEEQTNFTTYSLMGYVSEIVEKKYKEGKKRGQLYYLLKLGEPKGEILKANKNDLPANKWQQIQKLAILGQNLVFKYKKWITNKQLLDFYAKKDK